MQPNAFIGDPDIDFICAVSGGGTTSVILLTDDELAERYRASLDEPIVAFVGIPSPEDFLAFLEEMTRRGIHLATFDPPTLDEPRPVRVVAITKLISIVREQEHRRPMKAVYKTRLEAPNGSHTMTLELQELPNPLQADEHGVIRVGHSRVLLDVVVREFNNGASAERIADAYPTLALADVYAAVAYYLQHRGEVDEYLRARREDAERLRQQIEATQPDRSGLRAQLLARQARMEQEHAAPGK